MLLDEPKFMVAVNRDVHSLARKRSMHYDNENWNVSRRLAFIASNTDDGGN